MTDQQVPGAKAGSVEKAVNSTTALLIARFVIPALLGVVGFFMVQTLGDLKDNQKEFGKKLDGSQAAFAQKLEEMRNSFWQAQGILAKTQSEFSVHLGVLGEKVDNQGKRIDQLELNQFKGLPHP